MKKWKPYKIKSFLQGSKDKSTNFSPAWLQTLSQVPYATPKPCLSTRSVHGAAGGPRSPVPWPLQAHLGGADVRRASAHGDRHAAARHSRLPTRFPLPRAHVVLTGTQEEEGAGPSWTPSIPGAGVDPSLGQVTRCPRAHGWRVAGDAKGPRGILVGKTIGVAEGGPCRLSERGKFWKSRT